MAAIWACFLKNRVCWRCPCADWLIPFVLNISCLTVASKLLELHNRSASGEPQECCELQEKCSSDQKNRKYSVCCRLPGSIFNRVQVPQGGFSYYGCAQYTNIFVVIEDRVYLNRLQHYFLMEATELLSISDPKVLSEAQFTCRTQWTLVLDKTYSVTAVRE